MLALDDVHISYGHVPALRGVSLEISAGDFVGLLGANGAGKTTLLSAIFGLVPLRKGTIHFEGDSLLGLKPDMIARRGLALVPEGRHIFSTLSVKENLRIGALGGRSRSGSLADLDWIMELFPALLPLLDTTAGQLSGGEQQQLALARALISRPRLLLLDEPSLGLAPLIVRLIFEVLSDLSSKGVTILLAEQHIAQTIRTADRVYFLRVGELALSGTRDEISGREDLSDFYLGG
jgi:branched-chain amino acid transport system ATP-binding protein